MTRFHDDLRLQLRSLRCGNQLGQELFGELHRELERAEKSLREGVRSVFFRDARSEVKVGPIGL